MSVGWDGIPINVVKRSIETLKPHLTFTLASLNLLLNLKIDIPLKLLDIFPFSPIFKKYLKKNIHFRIVSFIERFNLIHEHNFVSGIKNHHFMQFQT